MDYLKLFQTHQEYEAFVSGGTMVRPNVSHCVQENEVHYNSLADPRLIVKYNVINANEPTLLYSYYEDEITATLLFDKVEIDGVEVSITDLDTAQGAYQLSSGEHTVKYTLKDNTTIATFLFDTCLNLTSVIIPNTVTTINRSPFGNCDNLTSVTIGNSVTTIGYAAFTNCIGLTSIVIPNSVTTIGLAAFYTCTNLTNITIPDSVTSIGDAAFKNCTSLTSVTIGNSVTSIGNDAFCGTNLDATTQAQITAINENGICAPLAPSE